MSTKNNKKIEKLFINLKNDKNFKNLSTSKKNLRECIQKKCLTKIPLLNIPLPIPKSGCKEIKCKKELNNVKKNTVKLSKSKNFNKLVNVGSKNSNSIKTFFDIVSKK